MSAPMMPTWGVWGGVWRGVCACVEGFVCRGQGHGGGGGGNGDRGRDPTERASAQWLTQPRCRRAHDLACFPFKRTHLNVAAAQAALEALLEREQCCVHRILQRHLIAVPVGVKGGEGACERSAAHRWQVVVRGGGTQLVAAQRLPLRLTNQQAGGRSTGTLPPLQHAPLPLQHVPRPMNA